MHNTPLENLEFSLTWSETNLRWLLGEEPLRTELIESTKANIEKIKKEILEERASK